MYVAVCNKHACQLFSVLKQNLQIVFLYTGSGGCIYEKQFYDMCNNVLVTSKIQTTESYFVEHLKEKRTCQENSHNQLSSENWSQQSQT